MGRAPCCDKANVKKGPWSPEEDLKLKDYIEKYGTGGNWIALPQKAGLRRCGKSCRLRWLNYLRPNIKHGEFSEEEDRIICALFTTIGSRWSIMAARLPGRTDNDIKNYWNTKLKKKLLAFPMAMPMPFLSPASPSFSSQYQQQITPSPLVASSSSSPPSLYEDHNTSQMMMSSSPYTPMLPPPPRSQQQQCYYYYPQEEEGQSSGGSLCFMASSDQAMSCSTTTTSNNTACSSDLSSIIIKEEEEEDIMGFHHELYNDINMVGGGEEGHFTSNITTATNRNNVWFGNSWLDHQNNHPAVMNNHGVELLQEDGVGAETATHRHHYNNNNNNNSGSFFDVGG